VLPNNVVKYYSTLSCFVWLQITGFPYYRPKPYGTITEHSVGYEQDSYKSPHYFQSITENKTEEKCSLITPETKTNSTTLYPFSGIANFFFAE